MAFKIIRSDTFESDLNNALDYLVEIAKSPSAAGDLVSCIDQATSLIAEMPYIRAISRKNILANMQLREFYVKSHVVVYRIDDDMESVLLVRFLGQSQQYDDDRYWEE